MIIILMLIKGSFLTSDTHVCVSVVRNVSVSENFANVLNEWSLEKKYYRATQNQTELKNN